MKKIYNSKVFWIIISCVLSFVLWIYVTSVQSDEVRQTFRGVRVELVGENVLRDSRSLVITDLSICCSCNHPRYGECHFRHYSYGSYSG